MKKLVLGLVLILVFLTACESANFVSDAVLVQNVKIDGIYTGSCGKNCTNYHVKLLIKDKKVDYQTSSDTFNSINNYIEAIKTLNGDTNVTYDAIVSPSKEWLLGVAPTKNRL